ncbi:osmoprotectant ABC transporter substrate-binding protein [Anaerosphaera multitolerans]|uniref:Osmoprotectant ABC transporter substrate-binding protein n=1 Tax=Anaerosphaera multitolerans TaxID=2487351 RepID=A0A437S6R9_9FIRM|nr:osmoprotectant ABC transporter substrate-binding protein [Anaerosphaera multitolerans]RVU54706.1 osmoprotectant ABC transporter substrate-binding protein [Anaerosphaera multitolerans]
MKLKKAILIILCAVLLTSCTFPGLGGDVKKDVVIASGNTTERQVLAEILKQMTEHHTDLNVSLINNLGSTTLIHTAMLKNEVNVSSGMYTGTSLTGELALEPVKDPKEALEICKEEYLSRYNRIWYDSYGFENTYAFMVSRKFAEENNIKTVSDLEALKDSIKVGVDISWMDRKGDGYEDFKKIYNFSFNKIYPMEIGLVYSAINNGEMDVVLGYSTDGRINSYDLVLLEDDKMLFPAYDCSPVASKTLIENHPELDKIFKVLSNKISSEDMQKMNREGDEDLVEPKIIAKEFLEEKNYFENEVNL